MLERLAKQNAEKVRIVKVDVSRHQKWAQEQSVRGIPTFQIYAGGSKLEQFSGAYPENFLQQKIDRHSASSASSAPSARADGGTGGQADAPAADTAIKPMPKDWLPPGVTRK